MTLDHRTAIRGTIRSVEGTMRPFALALLILLVTTPVSAIDLWRTPEGKMHVGDHPPAGSTLIRRTTDDDPPVDDDPASSDGLAEKAEELHDAVEQSVQNPDAFFVRASRERRRIEKNLNRYANRHYKLTKELEKTERTQLRVFSNSWATEAGMADAANFAIDKQRAIEKIEREQAAVLQAIVDLRQEFDQLNAEVLDFYDGEAPTWWNSTLRCYRCPF